MYCDNDKRIGSKRFNLSGGVFQDKKELDENQQNSGRVLQENWCFCHHCHLAYNGFEGSSSQICFRLSCCIFHFPKRKPTASAGKSHSSCTGRSSVWCTSLQESEAFKKPTTSGTTGRTTEPLFILCSNVNQPNPTSFLHLARGHFSENYPTSKWIYM